MLNVEKIKIIWIIEKAIKKIKSTCCEKIKIINLVARMYSTIFKMLAK